MSLLFYNWSDIVGKTQRNRSRFNYVWHVWLAGWLMKRINESRPDPRLSVGRAWVGILHGSAELGTHFITACDNRIDPSTWGNFQCIILIISVEIKTSHKTSWRPVLHSASIIVIDKARLGRTKHFNQSLTTARRLPSDPTSHRLLTWDSWPESW